MDPKHPEPRSIPATVGSGSAVDGITDDELMDTEVSFEELADAMRKVLKAPPMPWSKMLASRTEEQVYIAEKKARTRAKRRIGGSNRQ
ncbi:hypothetical protein L6V77_01255 [Myxococcota bacterium]|nr:hypothetical protein [Myxococcota bacterium]